MAEREQIVEGKVVGVRLKGDLGIGGDVPAVTDGGKKRLQLPDRKRRRGTATEIYRANRSVEEVGVGIHFAPDGCDITLRDSVVGTRKEVTIGAAPTAKRDVYV